MTNKNPVLKLYKFLLLIFVFPFLSFQINSSRIFTINDGLVDNYIVDIQQDKIGQLWVITRSSISIFNGSHWKNFSTKFQHQDNPFNEFLIDFKKIVIDFNDNKFFLSENGRVFLLVKNSLYELVSPFQTKGILFSDIQLVNEEQKQILWASTSKNGLAYFDNYWFSFGTDEGLLSNQILAIKSYNDILIVLTDKGIQIIKNRRIVFTLQSIELSRYKNFSIAFDKTSKSRENLPAIWILADYRLYKLENEKIYDVTYRFFNPFREKYSFVYSNGGNKLYFANHSLVKIVNPVSGEMQVLSKESGIVGSPNVLFVDNEKNLWIGTDKGLTRINFTSLIRLTSEQGLSDDKIIYSLKSNNDFYFAHNNGKISYYANGKFYRLNFQPQLSYYLQNPSAKKIDITKLRTFGKNIIFQSGDWGIFEIQTSTMIKPLYLIKNDSEFISDFIVTRNGGLILVGIFLSENQSKGFIEINSNILNSNAENIPSTNFQKVYQANDNSLWIVADDFHLYKIHGRKIENYDLSQINGSTKINCLHEDRGSNLFVGTNRGFVVILKTGEIKSYFENPENGKGGLEVYSFYFDDLNNAWMMTNKGLKFWNWKELKFSNDWKNIIPNKANDNCIDELNGKLFVSSENGLYILPPDEEEIIEIQPKAFITEIIIDDKIYDAISEIKLQSAKNLLIRFNAVMLSANNNIEFSYKLEGFDKEWSSPTNAREVRYANLPEGEYLFYVRVRTNFNQWSNPVSTNLIKIKKPFYYHYEYLLVPIFILIAFAFFYLISKSKKKPEEKGVKNLQEQIQGLEKQNKQLRQEISKALELSKSRMKFLASLSHELRTPINSIIGFIDLLLDPKLNLSEEEKVKYLNYISINSRKLLILINDIIDLAKIDSGTISLEYSTVNLNAEIRDTINLFREKIKSKQLDLILELDPQIETQHLYLDRNRLHQIISNLVTNAIKFTEEGFIKISTKKEEDKFLFIVEDTGIGIPEDEIEFIFEEFRRSSNAIRKSIEGTGLGLSITKRLVELMNGEIKVESQEGIGTTFTVSFPAKFNSEKKLSSDLKTNLN